MLLALQALSVLEQRNTGVVARLEHARGLIRMPVRPVQTDLPKDVKTGSRRLIFGVRASPGSDPAGPCDPPRPGPGTPLATGLPDEARPAA